MPRLQQHNIKLTKTIHIKQLYSLLESENLKAIHCIVDLSEFDFFYPIDIVQLSQIFILLVKKRCGKITINADFERKHKYLAEIGLIEFCNKNFNVPQTISRISSQTAMAIKRVERESMVQYITLAQQFLSEVCPEKDLTILHIGLSELINNVYDHSESPIGAYVFCQYYPNKKTIRFAVSDMGVGIPNKVKDYLDSQGENTKTDKECIEWAFEERKTIRSTPSNAGLGLNTIMSFVKVNQGRIRMLSDNVGLYWTNESERYFVNPIKPFKGTVVDIEINVNNLHAVDVQEVDFYF